MEVKDEAAEIIRSVQSLYLASRPHKDEAVDRYYASGAIFEDPLVYASGRHDVAANFRAIGWISHKTSIQTFDWFFCQGGGASDERAAQREIEIAMSRAKPPSGLTGTLRIDHTTVLYLVNGQIIKHKDLWSVADMASPLSLFAAVYMLARQLLGAAVGLFAWVADLGSYGRRESLPGGTEDKEYVSHVSRSLDRGAGTSTVVGSISGDPLFDLQQRRQMEQLTHGGSPAVLPGRGVSLPQGSPKLPSVRLPAERGGPDPPTAAGASGYDSGGSRGSGWRDARGANGNKSPRITLTLEKQGHFSTPGGHGEVKGKNGGPSEGRGVKKRRSGAGK